MADVVMRKEDSDTMSVKVILACFLVLSYQFLLCVWYISLFVLKELGAFLPPQPYKPSGYCYYPLPPQYPPPTDFKFSPPTTSVDHGGGYWIPVVTKLPSTPQDELQRHWDKLFDAFLKGSFDDVPRRDKTVMYPPPDIFDYLPPSLPLFDSQLSPLLFADIEYYLFSR